MGLEYMILEVVAASRNNKIWYLIFSETFDPPTAVTIGVSIHPEDSTIDFNLKH